MREFVIPSRIFPSRGIKFNQRGCVQSSTLTTIHIHDGYWTKYEPPLTVIQQTYVV